MEEMKVLNLQKKLIEFGGLGHSAVIHAEDEETILKFSEVVKSWKNNCKLTINTWCYWGYL